MATVARGTMLKGPTWRAEGRSGREALGRLQEGRHLGVRQVEAAAVLRSLVRPRHAVERRLVLQQASRPKIESQTYTTFVVILVYKIML